MTTRKESGPWRLGERTVVIVPLVPFPTRGDIFLDVRGRGRALRVTGHADDGFVVLSVWHGPVCTATVRLSPLDAQRLGDVLAALARDDDPAATDDGQAVAAT